MNYVCPHCKHKDSVDWTMKGFGLERMFIGFHCPKCGRRMVLQVVFPKSEKEKVEQKVEYEKLGGYIG